MQKFPQDNPNLMVHILAVEAAELGEAFEEPAQAIAILLDVESHGQVTLYGLMLSDGPVTCSLGPAPYAAMAAAKRITERWAAGEISVPTYHQQPVAA